MSRYILALDQGTTSSRAILFDSERNIIGISQRETGQQYPKPGWVEHDPMELYSSIYGVMTEVIAKSGVDIKDIAAIGITNQRETVVTWNNKTGRPLYNAICWQCRRTSSFCTELESNSELSEYIKENTGLRIDAYFSGTKIKWLLDNVEGVREGAENGDVLFGTVDTWLLWKLTDGKAFVTDYTNASRTMLYNIKELKWDSRLLNELGVPAKALPEVRGSSEVYGYVTLHGYDIPIAGIAGDQQAALFGQACFDKGEAKNTYGTGCFLLMNTGSEICHSKHGLLTTIAATTHGEVQYALEGSAFVGGAVIQWLRDEMRFINESRDAEYYAKKVKDTGGVYLVPAFAGLGAPFWDMDARGTITGITRGTKREHIIRAAQESIAYQVMELVEAMEKDTGVKLPYLNVDGGASRDEFLMQFQSDILNKQLRRPMIRETTALGAAYLAGLAVGVWVSKDEVKADWGCDRYYTPEMDEAARVERVNGWRAAVGKTMYIK